MLLFGIFLFLARLPDAKSGDTGDPGHIPVPDTAPLLPGVLISDRGSSLPFYGPWLPGVLIEEALGIFLLLV